MSRLIRLYPASWRDRYGDEFLELLAERPATFRDRFDVVRGALDAHIHPQVAARAEASAPARPIRIDVLGLAVGGAILAGLGGVLMYVTSVGPFGYKEGGVGVIAMVVGLAVVAASAVAMVYRDNAPMTRWIAALAMLCGAVGITLPWPMLIVGFFTHAIATIVFGVLFLVGGRRMSGGAIALAGLILPVFNTEDERALVMIPVAILWIVAGIGAARPARSTAPTPRTAVVPLGAD